MANIKNTPRLRDLCEKASKEFDPDKLIDLVRQINNLLEDQEENSAEKKVDKRPRKEEKKTCPLSWGVVAVNLIAKSTEGWLGLYPGIAPADGWLTTYWPGISFAASSSSKRTLRSSPREKPELAPQSRRKLAKKERTNLFGKHNYLW